MTFVTCNLVPSSPGSRHDRNNPGRLHKECKDDRSVSHLLNDNDDDLHHHDYQLSIVNIIMIWCNTRKELERWSIDCSAVCLTCSMTMIMIIIRTWLLRAKVYGRCHSSLSHNSLHLEVEPSSAAFNNSDIALGSRETLKRWFFQRDTNAHNDITSWPHSDTLALRC